MRKSNGQFLALGLLLISFLGSSCIDVLEDMYLRADGSGSMKVVMSMGRMGTFLEEMDWGDGNEKMGGLSAATDNSELVLRLQELEGIHDVKDLSEPERLVSSFSFEFDNLSARGEAMRLANASGIQASMGTEKEAIASGGRACSLKGEKFRSGGTSQQKPLSEGEEGTKMVLKMLEEAAFESRIHFEQEVRSVRGNREAVLLEDGHTLVIETTVVDLLRGESDLDCRVRLK